MISRVLSLTPNSNRVVDRLTPYPDSWFMNRPPKQFIVQSHGGIMEKDSQVVEATLPPEKVSRLRDCDTKLLPTYACGLFS